MKQMINEAKRTLVPGSFKASPARGRWLRDEFSSKYKFKATDNDTGEVTKHRGIVTATGNKDDGIHKYDVGIMDTSVDGFPTMDSPRISGVAQPVMDTTKQLILKVMKKKKPDAIFAGATGAGAATFYKQSTDAIPRVRSPKQMLYNKTAKQAILDHPKIAKQYDVNASKMFLAITKKPRLTQA